MRSRIAVAAVLTVLLLSTSTGAFAQSDPAWEGEVYEAVSEMVPTYNERVSEVDLGIAGDQLADRRVNVYVEDGDATAVYSFRTDADNRIEDFRRGAHPDARLRVTTSRATVVGVARADNPAAAFRAAVAGGDIVVTGERGHPVEQVKWTVINALRSVFL
jgi:hypothetical protein